MSSGLSADSFHRYAQRFQQLFRKSKNLLLQHPSECDSFISSVCRKLSSLQVDSKQGGAASVRYNQLKRGGAVVTDPLDDILDDQADIGLHLLPVILAIHSISNNNSSSDRGSGSAATDTDHHVFLLTTDLKMQLVVRHLLTNSDRPHPPSMVDDSSAGDYRQLIRHLLDERLRTSSSAGQPPSPLLVASVRLVVFPQHSRIDLIRLALLGGSVSHPADLRDLELHRSLLAGMIRHCLTSGGGGEGEGVIDMV